MKKLIILFTILISVNILQAQWLQTNGPVGGWVRTITQAPNEKIYAGTGKSNGIYRSDDLGITWKNFSTGLNSSEIYSIVSNKQGMLFAGGGGVYKSTNEGDNWVEVLSYVLTNTMAIDTNGVIIVAGMGIYRSTNEGTTWTNVANNLNTSVYAIGINSYNYIFAACINNGVLLSTNGGENWIQKNIGITTPQLLSLTITSDNTLFVGAIGGKIFKSTNNGENWSEVWSASGEHVQSLAKDLNDNIFAGTVNGGVVKSTDVGLTWEYLNQGITEKNIWAITPIGDSVILAGAEGSGIYRTTNSGILWIESNNGLAARNIDCILYTPDGKLFSGSKGAVHLSTDGGLTWDLANGGWTGFWSISLAYTEPQTIYMGEFGGGVFKTTNYGTNWNNLIPSGYAVGFAFNSFGDVFSIVTNKVYFSTDDGQYWTLLNNGLMNANAFCIAIDSSNSILLGTDRGIFKSSDNGVSWFNSNTGLTDTIVTEIIYVTSEIIFAGTNSEGAFRSTDAGITWVRQNSGLSSGWVGAMALWKNILIANVQGDAFITDDYGDNWFSWDEGLLNTHIFSFSIGDSNVYAATSAGVWKRPLKEMITNVESTLYQLPSNYSLNQNYPNPFNPTSTIRYSINERVKVSLKIFDILGREISTLVNDEKAAGRYEVVFNANGLASGIYFYRLQAGSYVETKKMILMK
jgi:photosystem II stability/assembly factor-like uncharacterized protein